MLVKAKWNVKDGAGWHNAGDIWNTENDLGDAVELLEKAQEQPIEVHGEPEQPVNEEPVKTAVKSPRTASRRKAASK